MRVKSFKKVIIERLRKMDGGLKIRLAMELSETVRKIFKDGQHTRRTA